MAFNEDTSFIEYPVDQPTQDFVTNFDTIGGTTDVVLVTVDGVLTDTPESSYTVQQINHTTWRVTPEVQTGSVVRLYRVTNIDEMMHVFTAGAKFIARNMDNNFKQIRHAQQEVRDAFDYLEYNTLGVVEAAKSATGLANTAAQYATQTANDAAAQVDDKIAEIQPALDSKLQEFDLVINTITVDGVVPALAVSDASGLNQQEVNNGVDSIADLLAIPNPKNGMRVYVKSYIAGAGKGAGTYVYDSAKSGISDGVLCINGWCLASTPDIFSGGVLADGSDDTVALQRTYDALHSIGMDIDLLGNTIKTISLDIDSNTVIKNGTLDVYDWDGSVDFPDTYPESNWRRTPIMLKNTPRNLIVDFEYSFKYPEVPVAENITFRNLKIRAKRRFFTAYKVNNILFDGCEFTWDSGEIINIIGGYHGTTFINDTDTETYILTPVNGYCNNVVISGNKFTCLTPTLMSSATHVVASKNVTVRNNKYYNVPLGSRLDIWNTKVNVFGNEYLFDNAAALHLHDTDPETVDSDYIGVYIGQNTSEVKIHNNVFDGVFRPIYVEVGSHVDIWGNNFKNGIGQRWWSYGILLQGNFRDFDNNYWGNTSFVTVRENTFRGFGSAIVNSTALPAGRKYGHQNIIVKDNVILGQSPHPSISLNKTLNLICSDNRVDGWVLIGTIGGVQDISGNTINHQSNDSSTYPLSISNTSGATINATNNKLTSNVSPCIQLINTTPSSCNLTGSMLAPSSSTNFLNTSNIGQIYGYVSTKYRTSFTQGVAVNLAAGAVSIHSVSIPNVRPNDVVSVHLQSTNSLWASYGVALDVKYEPVVGAVNLLIKNISSAPVNLTAVFFIHFQVSMAPL